MSASKPLRPDYPELTVRTRAAWRRWLQKHHRNSRGVWFVHFGRRAAKRGSDTTSWSSNFEALAPGYRRQYIAWVASAKRDVTRARRLDEALRLLADGAQARYEVMELANSLGYVIARVGDSDRRGSAVRASIRIFRP